MAQQALATKHDIEEEPLEAFLEEVDITEEEFRASVEAGLKEFREGKTIPHEQLKRECGLA